MGFIIHFYIIFGTNLLTGGPVQIAIFCLFQCFAEKEYQTESNRNDFRERDFWNKRDPEDLEWTSRNQRGGHEAGGRALHPRGPLVAPPTYFFLLYIPTYPNHRGAPRKPNSTAATFCTREIPSWGLFRSSAGGSINHGGLLHQHHSLSDEV